MTQPVDDPSFPARVETLSDATGEPETTPSPKEVTRSESVFNRVLGGRYRAVSRIGSGGFADVLLAHGRCPDNVERFVAVKSLHVRLRQNPVAVQRLQREVSLLHALRHPGLPQIYDWLPAEFAVVMERVVGEPLTVLIEGPSQTQWLVIREVFAALLDVLSYLHQHQICHRDVKPSNILLSWMPDGKPKVSLLDLGLATRLRESSARESRKLTRSGIPIGSPRYMSPEQCRGDRVALASDVYSVGVILYEAICGHHPYPAQTTSEFLAAHQRQEPQPLSFADPEKKSLIDLAFSALAKEASARPTVDDLLSALRTLSA